MLKRYQISKLLKVVTTSQLTPNRKESHDNVARDKKTEKSTDKPGKVIRPTALPDYHLPTLGLTNENVSGGAQVYFAEGADSNIYEIQ